MVCLLVYWTSSAREREERFEYRVNQSHVSSVYLAFDVGACLHELIEGCRIAEQYCVIQHGAVVVGKGFARISFGNEP